MPIEPAATALTFDIERKDDVIIVHCHGRLVSGVNNTLYAAASKEIPGSKRIVLGARLKTLGAQQAQRVRRCLLAGHMDRGRCGTVTCDGGALHSFIVNQGSGAHRSFAAGAH